MGNFWNNVTGLVAGRSMQARASSQSASESMIADAEPSIIPHPTSSIALSPVRSPIVFPDDLIPENLDPTYKEDSLLTALSDKQVQSTPATLPARQQEITSSSAKVQHELVGIGRYRHAKNADPAWVEEHIQRNLGEYAMLFNDFVEDLAEVPGWSQTHKPKTYQHVHWHLSLTTEQPTLGKMVGSEYRRKNPAPLPLPRISMTSSLTELLSGATRSAASDDSSRTTCDEGGECDPKSKTAIPTGVPSLTSSPSFPSVFSEESSLSPPRAQTEQVNVQFDSAADDTCAVESCSPVSDYSPICLQAMCSVQEPPHPYRWAQRMCDYMQWNLSSGGSSGDSLYDMYSDGDRGYEERLLEEGRHPYAKDHGPAYKDGVFHDRERVEGYFDQSEHVSDVPTLAMTSSPDSESYYGSEYGSNTQERVDQYLLAKGNPLKEDDGVDELDRYIGQYLNNSLVEALDNAAQYEPIDHRQDDVQYNELELPVTIPANLTPLSPRPQRVLKFPFIAGEEEKQRERHEHRVEVAFGRLGLPTYPFQATTTGEASKCDTHAAIHPAYRRNPTSTSTSTSTVESMVAAGGAKEWLLKYGCYDLTYRVETATQMPVHAPASDNPQPENPNLNQHQVQRETLFAKSTAAAIAKEWLIQFAASELAGMTENDCVDS